MTMDSVETWLLVVSGIGCVATAAYVAVSGYTRRTVTVTKVLGEPARRNVEHERHWLPRPLAVVWFLGGAVLLWLAATSTGVGRFIRKLMDWQDAATAQLGTVMFIILGPVFTLLLLAVAVGLFIEGLLDKEERGGVLAGVVAGALAAALGWWWWTITFG